MIVELMLIAASLQATPDYAKRYDAPSLPKQLWGSWDSSVKNCREQYSTTRLAIGIDWVGFYESEGKLMITTAGGSPDGESIVGRFVMGGEASTWDLELRFNYSLDRPNLLKLAFEKGGQEESYVRCKAPS